MKLGLGWVMVGLLCWGWGATAQEAREDTRLVEARAALEAGVKLKDEGRYSEAGPPLERALSLREAVLGSSHPDVASALNVLGDLLWRQRKHVRAEEMLRRSLAIREAVLGKDHPDVAASLDTLANLLTDLGFYPRAALLYARALAIREATLGDVDLDVATSLSHLARLHQFQGLYGRAEPLFVRALTLRESIQGKDHPDVAGALNSLAAVWQLQGQYRRAEAHYARALKVYTAALGKDHLLVAYSLGNLAFLYQDMGQYERAAQFHESAIPILEARLGEEHPKVADARSVLAQNYDGRGLIREAELLYGQALASVEETLGKDDEEAAFLLINLANRIDPLYERALAISEERAIGKGRPRLITPTEDPAFVTSSEVVRRVEQMWGRMVALHEAMLGEFHPDVAAMLLEFARTYLDLHKYKEAEPLVERALAIREATFGKMHPQVAAALDTLALLYQRQGLFDRAEPLQRRALTLWEATLGKAHSDVAYSLIELARTCQYQGRYTAAESYLLRALAIREAALGETHSDVATTLLQLADVYQAQGLYSRATPLVRRALVIQEVALGAHHPAICLTLNKLASLRLAQHRLREALPLFTRGFDISERLIRQEALEISDARLAGVLQVLRVEEEYLYSLLRDYPGDPGVRRLALAAVLLRKGRSTEELASISRTVYRGLGEQDHATIDLLRSLRTQRARLELDGPGPLSSDDYKRRLRELAERGDTLESELARRSAPLRALATLPPPDQIVDRVASALPREGALVEFVEYAASSSGRRPGSSGAKPPAPRRYLALVLFPDSRSAAVDLGPAAPLEQASDDLRRALARRDADFQPLARKLHDLAFKPLMPLLGDIRRVLIAPDGQLSLVSFAALHDGQGFLIDSFDISYLTSGKDLLPRPQESASSNSVLVLADPDFRAQGSPSFLPPREDSSDSPRAASLERFLDTRGAALTEQAWPQLPGTRQEAETIQRLIPQAQLFLGTEASKQRLLRMSAPGVLHIATHGFFFEDASPPPGSRAIGQFGLAGAAARRPEDPLLCSGLVLSGAHAPDSATPEAARSRADSSLVTALELAGMDLWGTQLVVLSACDTGRGDVKAGQGVYGLRRALVTAGAETVVMTLWKVADDATRLLMEDYYRHLLEGQGRAEALRKAMLSLREKRPHPFFWAPFIAVGSDAPLRALVPSP